MSIFIIIHYFDGILRELVITTRDTVIVGVFGIHMLNNYDGC